MVEYRECDTRDSFRNRYRITGTLETRSPFHLGNGEFETRKGLINKESAEKDKPVKVSAIATDWEGKPVIPGSALKGSLRGYLLDVLQHFGRKVAFDNDFEKLAKEDDYQTQAEQIRFIKNSEDVSHLERLFGTPWYSSKIEVWDANLIIDPTFSVDARLETPRPPYWDKKRWTFVDQSVAIDPKTHTALDKRLYHYDVVPPGLKFEVNITGRNLGEMELGMLLLGLEAFNSDIWPLTLGGMGGRGFGRFRFTFGKLYCLKADQLPDWIETSIRNNHAGYYGIDSMETRITECIDHYKECLLKKLETNDE